MTLYRWIVFTSTLVVVTLIIPTGGSGTSNTKESRFGVYSHGFRIGDVTSKYTLSSDSSGSVLKFSSSASIDAHFVFRSYSLESREEALVGREGTLRYSRASMENGRSVDVQGVLENNSFGITIRENSTTRPLTFPRDQYDYTTMECPEIHLKREGDKMAARLLDLETLEIVTRRYTWVRTEDVQVGGRNYTCRVIDFEDKNKKSRRWIRPDDIGVMIVRQEGQGKNGSYTVKLLDYFSR